MGSPIQPRRAHNEARPSERLRLFIAVPAPRSWRPWLSRLQRSLELELPGYFRWTAPESWHLTVLFLGSQPSDSVPMIQSALQSVAESTPAPTLTAQELGALGPPTRPRLVWLRVDDGGVLGEAQRALRERLSGTGLESDAKPYIGHITLGRARLPSRVNLGRAIAMASNHAAPVPTAEVAPELIMYRSHLDQREARYEALCGSRFLSVERGC